MQVVLIDGEKMDIPALAVYLANPSRSVNTAAETYEQDAHDVSVRGYDLIGLCSMQMELDFQPFGGPGKFWTDYSNPLAVPTAISWDVVDFKHGYIIQIKQGH
jgi:hypothetical protein